MTALEFCELANGKPWVNRAEGMDCFDCWGLVIASFRHVDGLEMPQSEKYGDPNCSTGEAATDVLSTGLYSQCEPTEGAIVCVYDNHGNMTHVGRILCGRVLHASMGLGVRHDTIKLFIRAHSNVRFYKYHANNHA